MTGAKVVLHVISCATLPLCFVLACARAARQRRQPRATVRTAAAPKKAKVDDVYGNYSALHLHFRKKLSHFATYSVSIWSDAEWRKAIAVVHSIISPSGRQTKPTTQKMRPKRINTAIFCQ